MIDWKKFFKAVSRRLRLLLLHLDDTEGQLTCNSKIPHLEKVKFECAAILPGTNASQQA